MRYHRHLFIAASECLQSIFFEDRYADKAIEFYFRKNKKWGKRDRQFFAEMVYDCVRWWRLYGAILGKEPSAQNVVEIMCISLWHRNFPLPEFEDLANLDPQAWQKNLDNIKEPAVLQSVPDWIYELGQECLGKKWSSVIAGLNRVNKILL